MITRNGLDKLRNKQKLWTAFLSSRNKTRSRPDDKIKQPIYIFFTGHVCPCSLWPSVDQQHVFQWAAQRGTGYFLTSIVWNRTCRSLLFVTEVVLVKRSFIQGDRNHLFPAVGDKLRSSLCIVNQPGSVWKQLICAEMRYDRIWNTLSHILNGLVSLTCAAVNIIARNMMGISVPEYRAVCLQSGISSSALYMMSLPHMNDLAVFHLEALSVVCVCVCARAMDGC